MLYDIPSPATATATAGHEKQPQANPNNTLQELYEIIGCELAKLVQISRNTVMVRNGESKCNDIKELCPFPYRFQSAYGT